MPKITPEIEKQIREAAGQSAARSGLCHTEDFTFRAASHILDALDDLAEAQRERDALRRFLWAQMASNPLDVHNIKCELLRGFPHLFERKADGE